MSLLSVFVDSCRFQIGIFERRHQNLTNATDANGFCGGLGKVDQTASSVGSPIIDGDNDGLIGFKVGDHRLGIQREGLVSGG